MKYILVIGIQYQKYKNPATIIVSAGDRMIDEFEIDLDLPEANEISQHINSDHYLKFNREPWLSGPAWDMDSMPEFFKVYKIDEMHLNDRITIKVNNSNSDFTNGFMNKNSIIKFPVVAMFPERLAKNKCERMFEMIVKFDQAEGIIRRRHNKDKRFSNPTNPPLYYGVRPGNMIGPINRGPALTVLNRQVIWPALYYLKINFIDGPYNKDGLYPCGHWLGGSFNAELLIGEKHGMKYLHTHRARSQGLWSVETTGSLVIASLKQLINTYNED